MRAPFALGLLVLASTAAAAEPELQSEHERTLYAIGVAASESFRTFDLTATELELVQQGLRDALEGKGVLVDPSAFRGKVDALALQRRATLERKLVDRYAAEPGASRTQSGLVFVPLAEGKGPGPMGEDVVKVQYVGRLADGTVFDDTGRKSGLATIPLGQAIPCWKEALPMMKVGGKARVACPPALAYGERGMPRTIPPDVMIFFEIELVSIPARVMVTDKPIPGTLTEGTLEGQPGAPSDTGSASY
jgi:FKBP-type peptidyl-prolyl cis-trans isomerase FkpA